MAQWWIKPDLAGNWRTPHANIVSNMMQLDFQEANFFNHPLNLSILEPHQQYWPIGWMPVGGDFYPRAVFSNSSQSKFTSSPKKPPFVLGESKLGDPGTPLG